MLVVRMVVVDEGEDVNYREKEDGIAANMPNHHWEVLNPLRARNIKCIYIIFIIPPFWQDTGSLNPSSYKTRTYLFYIINIMGVDVLVTQGARASVTMILTMLNWNNSSTRTLGFNQLTMYAAVCICIYRNNP